MHATEASSQREIEVKLEGESAALVHAFRVLSGERVETAEARELLSTYFDTPGNALWIRGYVLRIRVTADGNVMTLKRPETGSPVALARNEVNVTVSGLDPEVSLFGEEIADEIEEIASGVPLIARFTVQVRRRTSLVECGASSVEVALDTGFVVDGAVKAPLQELEFELKTGDPAVVFELAQRVAEEFSLHLGVLTKSARGYALAAGELLPVRKAKPPAIAAGASLDDLIAASVEECAEHFAGNWPVLVQSDQPEAIHQMRVGLRRLRALLAVFARRIPSPKLIGLRKEAGEIAGMLGQARDSDVFIEEVKKGPLQHFERDASFEALLSAAATRRDEGYGRAHALLAAPQTTRFVLELHSLVARRGWREGLEPTALFDLAEPAKRFAAEALSRLSKRALKKGKSIEDLLPEDRHKLRIALKNIRYCVEAFGPLFDAPAAARAYVRAAARLQDLLGAYNDAVQANTITAELEKQCGETALRAVAVIAGWSARGVADADEILSPAYGDFRKAKRFWKKR